ncbi:TetR family transcriptional regulator [Streptomyces sp. CNQ-509]|uniref:TetR/AcrR family transcriptional regulator n=1 Tax=unclassified Streptomyces TaxID=2593676 RepID=UPI00062DFFEC|nr:TetR/AcrR family transcriptional regulator [Streptomyces sp. CNQ-509]AKH83668.1 TetR family transcriptional regulator [Streptomyces sp. CNQ-509]
MAVKGAQTRARLVEAARTLVEARGYHGTGLNDVIAAGSAPRGSLYHHFPGGKDQLTAEALTVSGREITIVFADLADSAPDTRSLMESALSLLADRMEEAAYAKGCPVATVALEVSARNDALRQVCAEIYDRWQRVLADRLIADGRSPADAEDLACSLLALTEGALILSRTRRSRAPMEQARRTARALLDG